VTWGQVTLCASVKTEPRPFESIMEPRVAINGGSPIPETIRPFSNPNTVPINTQISKPNTTGTLFFVMSAPETSAEQVSTVPMERSMPPVQ